MSCPTRFFCLKKYCIGLFRNRARVYGVNSIGLVRNGFSQEVIVKLKRAYRYLLQSKLNTSQALARIEMDPSLDCSDVDYLVEFIKSSERGVSLRRSFRHHFRGFEDEEIIAVE